MIDDAKVRLEILKNIPSLDPQCIEMEEIDFGDAIGASVLIKGARQRFQTPAFHFLVGRQYFNESEIATALTEQIKRALNNEVPKRRPDDADPRN